MKIPVETSSHEMAIFKIQLDFTVIRQYIYSLVRDEWNTNSEHSDAIYRYIDPDPEHHQWTLVNV